MHFPKRRHVYEGEHPTAKAHPLAEAMSYVVMHKLLYVNRFVSRHICLPCTPTYACAYSSGMAFARAGWCLSSYYKFMAVGEANADQPRARDEERKSI
ncbi:Uncharacterized protein DBV15_08548 [Temnothorax longispinosus]|uniref:Uncharacterized protein n=1 Tax=Temnothorax longispinosus TaxID=300112 RepID=A0A4S2L044_9HYME|nr:Uncharacterized protein DBV15_08548 [Temnothorax longispinosus]